MRLAVRRRAGHDGDVHPLLALDLQKYAAKRAELKAKKDYAGLTQLPRDASPVRLVNRCAILGRRHAFIRKFNCSRLTFREMALNGMIPGVVKASW